MKKKNDWLITNASLSYVRVFFAAFSMNLMFFFFSIQNVVWFWLVDDFCFAINFGSR